MTSTFHEMQDSFFVSDEKSVVVAGVCGDCGGWIVHEFGRPQPSGYPNVSVIESDLMYSTCTCDEERAR